MKQLWQGTMYLGVLRKGEKAKKSFVSYYGPVLFRRRADCEGEIVSEGNEERFAATRVRVTVEIDE